MSESFTVKSIYREYEVLFDRDIKEMLAKAILDEAFFIIDKKVFELYKDLFSGLDGYSRVLVVDARESNKNLDFCQDVIKKLIDAQFRKNNFIVAIGGGIVQDIACFTATVLYRGVEWVFVPTTLLAQGDSCIGSKSSINIANYKNLIGSFYPPSKIYIDSAFLESLDESDIKSGIGEMLHFFFIDGSELPARLCKDYENLIVKRSLLSDYTRKSLAIKKSVIEIDEFDMGVRNIFNYGHTFGHAIEAVTFYGVSHGQAVTLGMDIANFVSLRMGMLAREDFDAMHAILKKNIPAFKLEEDGFNGYFEALSRDKKNVGNKIGCILTRGPGKMEKVLCALDGDGGLKESIRLYFKDAEVREIA